MDKSRFEVSQVNLSVESPVPRSGSRVDFHHVEGTNPSNEDQVLDKYLDMDQDEYVFSHSLYAFVFIIFCCCENFENFSVLINLKCVQFLYSLLNNVHAFLHT